MAKDTAKKDKDIDDKLAKAHLCSLVSKGEMKAVAQLAKGAKFICTKCGRAAAKADNLCKPEKL